MLQRLLRKPLDSSGDALAAGFKTLPIVLSERRAPTKLAAACHAGVVRLLKGGASTNRGFGGKRTKYAAGLLLWNGTASL
jgi:hypothetical protein